MRPWILPAVIGLLALADGILHLSLDILLFRGEFLRNRLSQLFLLNAIGYLVLVAAFFLGPRWLGARRWLVDLALIGYAVATFVTWLTYGRPNPLGLGYVSKAIEIMLVVALLAHLLVVARRPRPGEARPARPSTDEP
ncbi:MAG TPA: hypothetical protein VEQ11_15100 [Chloroflexota bacterium]|nr:hypothetical protein [Chloroflexota bacterium]